MVDDDTAGWEVSAGADWRAAGADWRAAGADWRAAGVMGSRVRRSLAVCAGRLRPASTSSSRAPISP